MKNLSDTQHLMCSADYKERFIAEYWQVKLRRDSLHKMLIKWEAFIRQRQEWCIQKPLYIEEVLGFEPSCSYEVLKDQERLMEEYIHILELRAAIEKIDLYAEIKD